MPKIKRNTFCPNCRIIQSSWYPLATKGLSLSIFSYPIGMLVKFCPKPPVVFRQATLLEMALRKVWGFVIAMIILLVLIYTKFYKDAINSITHEVSSDFEYIDIAPIRNLNYTYIDN